jgi:hypothetical protein
MPVPKDYEEINEFYNRKTYKTLWLRFDDNNPRQKYVKVQQIGDIKRFNKLLDTDLQIVVRQNSSGIKGPVERNIFDLVYAKKSDSIKNSQYDYEYNVKPIGRWATFGGVVDGPLSFEELKNKYFIYIKNEVAYEEVKSGNQIFKSFRITDDNGGIAIGGKTRRRRRAKKASRKSRSNRKR